jgi:hypothetical protein
MKFAEAVLFPGVTVTVAAAAKRKTKKLTMPARAWWAYCRAEREVWAP